MKGNEEFVKYTIFLTDWGWAGFVYDKKGLRNLALPEGNKEDILFRIKNESKSNALIKEDIGQEDLILKIKEYFRGKKIDFSDWRLNLEKYTIFQRKIMQVVQKIPYGETKSYKWVAQTSGYPRAYRAVGNTMRNNPLPLVIPCHRVIKSDGGLGGFSGKEGIAYKKKMIDFESRRK